MTAKTSRYIFLSLALVLLLMTACSQTDNRSASDQNSRPSDPPQDATKPSPDNQWTVTVTGFGPVRAGMTVAEALQALGGDLTAIGPVAECYYVRSDRAPSGISFVVADASIARVDVESTSVATSAGARVGDGEERIKALYPGQAAVTPHKYTNGHYVIVTPGDSGHHIIFETDGKKVIRYRAGRIPEVTWVEGCS